MKTIEASTVWAATQAMDVNEHYQETLDLLCDAAFTIAVLEHMAAKALAMFMGSPPEEYCRKPREPKAAYAARIVRALSSEGDVVAHEKLMGGNTHG